MLAVCTHEVFFIEQQLKLSGMADGLTRQLEQTGTYDNLPFTERLQLLLDEENLMRTNRKQDRLIRQAHFKLKANVQDIDYQHPRNITQSQIARLAQADWTEKGQNLLITGPCGSGKTYLACAIGHNTCLHEITVRYYRLSRLLLMLTQAKADGSYHKQLKLLARLQLLIIDDWGLEPLKPTHRNDLLEILDDRHGTTSTMVISQLPTDPALVNILLVHIPWKEHFNTFQRLCIGQFFENMTQIAIRFESMIFDRFDQTI